MIKEFSKYKLFRKYITSDGVNYTPIADYQARYLNLDNQCDCGYREYEYRNSGEFICGSQIEEPKPSVEGITNVVDGRRIDAYFKTGVKITKNTKQRIKFKTLLPSGGVMIGGTIANNDNSDYRIFQYSSTLVYDIPGEGSYGKRIEIGGGTDKTFDYMFDNFSITDMTTGKVIASQSSNPFSDNVGELQFGFLPDNLGAVDGAVIYSWQIYDGVTLVRDFIPKVDGLIGMFDRVEGKFYPSEGTENFAMEKQLFPTKYEQTSKYEIWKEHKFCPDDPSIDELTGKVDYRNPILDCDCGYREYEYRNSGEFICGSELFDQPTFISNAYNNNNNILDAYFDTGVKIKSSIKQRIKFLTLAENNYGFISTTELPPKTCPYEIGIMNDSKIRFNVPGEQYGYCDYVLADITRDKPNDYMFDNFSITDMATGRVIIEGNKWVDNTSGVLGNIMFGKNAASKPDSVRIYSWQIYDGDTLVRDFIPKKENGRVGMFDQVENKFYASEGTEEFSYDYDYALKSKYEIWKEHKFCPSDPNIDELTGKVEYRNPISSCDCGYRTYEWKNSGEFICTSDINKFKITRTEGKWFIEDGVKFMVNYINYDDITVERVYFISSRDEITLDYTADNLENTNSNLIISKIDTPANSDVTSSDNHIVVSKYVYNRGNTVISLPKDNEEHFIEFMFKKGYDSNGYWASAFANVIFILEEKSGFEYEVWKEHALCPDDPNIDELTGKVEYKNFSPSDSCGYDRSEYTLAFEYNTTDSPNLVYKINGRDFTATYSPYSIDINLALKINKIKSYERSFAGTKITKIKSLPNARYVYKFTEMFQGCNLLEEFNFPDMRILIEEGKFPSDVYFKNMFNGCSSLKNVNLENLSIEQYSPRSYFSGMFKNCQELTNVNLKGINVGETDSIESMFEGCVNLQNVDFTNAKISFNHYNSYPKSTNTFKDCRSLKSIDLSMFAHGKDKKDYCDMLSTFYHCDSLTSINLSGWYIGQLNLTFQDCSMLEEIILDNAILENIYGSGDACFVGCPKLKTIYMRGCSDFSIKKIKEHLTKSNIPTGQVTIITQ